MSFIELTQRDSQGITINTDHIAKFDAREDDNTKVPFTEIVLVSLLPAMGHIRVHETYDEVSRAVQG